MRNKAWFGVGIWLLAIGVSPALAGGTTGVPANVVGVWSGPIQWGMDGGGVEYRLVVTLNEVEHRLAIERVTFGEEECCAQVAAGYPLREGLPEHIYEVRTVEWVGAETVRFDVAGTTFEVQLGRDNPVVRKLK